MAVNSTSTVAGPFVGNGVTTVFPFTFSAIDPQDVAVLLRTSLADTLLTSGYSVVLTGVGGNVIITTPPPTGVSVYIFSDPDFSQDISFTDGGRYLADTVNEVNDRAAIRDLALRALLARTVRLPLGEASPPLPVASQRAGKVLGFDGSGALVLLAPGSGGSGSPGAITASLIYAALQNLPDTSAGDTVPASGLFWSAGVLCRVA